LVKKKELKKRAIYVYPPSEMSEKWKNIAKESGESISKFVIEHVENSLNRDVEGFSSRSTLLEENKHLRETLQDKDKRVEHLELLVEKLEEDLRFYRSKMFTDTGFTGVRSYDRKLIEILREPGTHSTEELLSRLRIKQNETEATKAISKQLENLEAYGLARSTMKGWIWKE
jgi:predicted DNA-binding protein